MPELLGQLLPLAVLGFLSPVPIAIVVTLLMTDGGLAKAGGFVSAAATVYLATGVLALTLPLDWLGSVAAVVGGVLLTAYGLLLWWWAVDGVRRGQRAPDARSSFLDRVGALSLRTVIVSGLVLTIVNVKQFGLYLVAVTAIVDADVTAGQQWVTMMVLAIVFQGGQLLLIGLYVAQRQRAAGLLARLHAWLLRRMRIASIALGSVVGTLFLVLGVNLLTS